MSEQRACANCEEILLIIYPRSLAKLFELGIIGVDFGGAVVFVEIQFGDLSLLPGNLFHLIFL